MPRKSKIEQLPKDIRIVQFSPGEFKPLYVKASDIGKVVVGLSAKTLANWRSQGVGPAYNIINGQIYYQFSILEKFFNQNLVKTIHGD
jgi:hypothetical protein